MTPDTTPDAALSTAAGTAEDEPGTYTLNMTYTADGKIDFDALRAAIGHRRPARARTSAT